MKTVTVYRYFFLYVHTHTHTKTKMMAHKLSKSSSHKTDDYKLYSLGGECILISTIPSTLSFSLKTEKRFCCCGRHSSSSITPKLKAKLLFLICLTCFLTI